MARPSRFTCLALLLSAALLVQSAGAAEPLRSGPQVGEKVPGAFKVLNLNGPDAGKAACLYCRNGSRPMIMVFTREISPAVTSLLQKLEAALAANPNSSLSACVIFCSDDQTLAGRLVPWVKQMNLNQVTVAVGSAAGPAKYNLPPEAAVTALLYTHFKVQANHTFRAGELQDASINAILADLPKILSK
jgi:hypothetical protein